jgi:TRAP-type C4-dicarboxylate transport system substrate-binding protein
MKGWFARIAACLLIAGIASGAQAQQFTLNINTALTTDDPMYAGLERLRDALAAKSGNRLQAKIFPGSQLGPDEDVLEQARAGAAVAVLVDGGRLAPFVKEFGILGAPYVADGFPELRKLTTTAVFADWVEKLRKASNHQVLSFNWFQGQRHVLAAKGVKEPADLKGIRMRTPGAPVWLETVRAMGATPTPMPWTDVYSALQLKAIDGAEAQHPATYGSRLYEVIKHITKTGHINLITGLVGSRVWFDKLPADLQKLLKDEAFAAGDWASEETIKSLAKYEALMKEKGVEIHEIDVTPFKQATLAVYDKLGYADLRKQVSAAIGKN